MKTSLTIQPFLLAVALTGFVLLSGHAFAQQKPDDQHKEKKTVTIHVTTEADGITVVTDTTIVITGDFDADAFLDEKGKLKDRLEGSDHMEKQIIIRRPGAGGAGESEADEVSMDTIIINGDRVIVIKEGPDMEMQEPRDLSMPFHGNFNMPGMFSPMPPRQMEAMMQGMLRLMGLDGVMPFGDMKQVVVKKKRHGRKVTITFEDRKGDCCDHSHGNRKEENVMIYRNSEDQQAAPKEVRVIIEDQSGKRVIYNEDANKAAPAPKQTKVIIIKEEKTK